MKQTVVKADTYEFLAYPVEYDRSRRWQNHAAYSCYKGWHYGLLSVVSCSSLKEAKRAIDRLRRVYQLTKRSHLLKDPKLLKIERVTRRAP